MLYGWGCLIFSDAIFVEYVCFVCKFAKNEYKFIMTKQLLLTLMLLSPLALMADGDEQTAPPIDTDIPETAEPIPMAPGPIVK